VILHPPRRLYAHTDSRYNLKRRVASLPPISSEVFTEKVLQARAATTAQADKAGFEQTCEACQKTYYSENSFRNHLSSAKHKAKAAARATKPTGKNDDEASSMSFSLGEPAAESVADSEAEEEFNEVVEGLKKTGLDEPASPVKRPSNPHLSAQEQNRPEHPISQSSSEEQIQSATPVASTEAKNTASPTPKTCLFCNHESETPPLNVAHMEKVHGMFLPERQYLVDLEGLLGYLQKKVFELNECLICGKMKANVFAVQTHMRDKGHCQIPYTTEEEQLEIGDFYDFRSTYSDGEWEDVSDEEEESQNAGAKLGAHRETKIETEDGDEVMDDGDWETDSDASSLDTEDLTAVPADQHYHQYDRLNKHKHHSRSTARVHKQADGFHAQSSKRPVAVFYDDYELHLPGGKSVGHRSLARYYRQNLYRYPTAEERAERLAIEAAKGEDAMDIDGDEATRGRDRNPRSRALIPRDMRGLGITTLDDKRTRAIVTKGKKEEWENTKNKDFLQARLAIKERAPHPATYMR
jgi:pre-60S factor REI1